MLHGDVEVNCPADKIPKYVEVEVTKLEVDDSLKFKDLSIPEGAELIPNPEGIVVKCAQARRAAALNKAQELQEAGKPGAAPGAAKKPEAKK